MLGNPSRVLRGGSFNNNARNLLGAYRNNNHPENDNDNLGFRVVWSVAGGRDVAEPCLRSRSCGVRAVPVRRERASIPVQPGIRVAALSPRAKKKVPRSSGSASERGAGGRFVSTLGEEGRFVDDQLLPAIQKAYDLNLWLLG